MLEIIVPAYNAEATLMDAILSLMCCPEVSRVTVVDDASTDSTVEALRDLVRSCTPKLRVICLETNGGQYRAKNVALGLLEDTTRFVGFQDIDDISNPDRFTRSLEALQEVDVVSGGMTQMDAGNASLPTLTGEGYPFDPAPNLLRAYGVNMVMGVTTCRREVFERLGGFEPVWGGGDTQFFCRAAMADLRLRNLSGSLGVQRMHKDQCTAKQSKDPVRAAYRRRNQASHLWWKQMKEAGKLRDWHLYVAPARAAIKEIIE